MSATAVNPTNQASIMARLSSPAGNEDVRNHVAGLLGLDDRASLARVSKVWNQTFLAVAQLEQSARANDCINFPLEKFNWINPIMKD